MSTAPDVDDPTDTPVGAPTVRHARVDDGPRLARLLPGGDDPGAAERALSLVPDPDEVSRLLLVAELAGEVVGFATLVWIHQLQLAGPEAHVAELVVAAPLTDVADRAPAAVERALRTAIGEQAELLGAARISGPGWVAPDPPPVVRELPVGDTALAVPALRELRPNLPVDDAAVVARIDRVQRPEGYRLLAVLPDGGGPALAVAGFRRVSNLAWGDVLYVDDLVTREAARGRGAASALLTAIDDEASRLGLAAVHLDSGHGVDRAAAHRAYLRHGYRISSHHFARELTGR
jgi:GNAT superfamily N-acetyltransferase